MNWKWLTVRSWRWRAERAIHPKIDQNNWLFPPHHRYAFRRAQAFVPTMRVGRSEGPVSTLDRRIPSRHALGHAVSADVLHEEILRGAVRDPRGRGAIEHYLPKLARSGFAEGTIRQNIDMAAGIHFVKDYAVG